MTRYPHALHVFTIPESTPDSNGNWVATTGEWEIISECRVSPNGSGKSVALTDGSTLLFSSSILMPVQSAEIQAGTEIKVLDENGNVKFTGKVLRFSNDRKNATIWA
jgi:hypothetical protein